MEAKEQVNAFVNELRSIVGKHFGDLPSDEVEPIGMTFRQVLPMVSGATGSITTTATVSLPADTDPADSDD